MRNYNGIMASQYNCNISLIYLYTQKGIFHMFFLASYIHLTHGDKLILFYEALQSFTRHS